MAILMNKKQIKSEYELAESLRRGDASAMGEIYTRYANYLTGVCSRYIAEDEDVRDVLQESFIKIFTKISSFIFQGEGSLRAWITQVVVNESLLHLRNQKRHGMIVFDGERVEDKEDDPPEETDIGGIPTDVLWQMIRELPPGYRAVFNLYVIEGKRHKEIANLLGIQEQTSASQLLRAKRLLAKQINEYRILKQEPR
jgi:RNA polymerase sigma-70 factor (ECF subfamily)